VSASKTRASLIEDFFRDGLTTREVAVQSVRKVERADGESSGRARERGI
jgi:hypothetical protein